MITSLKTLFSYLSFSRSREFDTNKPAVTKDLLVSSLTMLQRVPAYLNEIKNYVQTFPDKDVILCFNKKGERKEKIETTGNNFTAGSSVLANFMKNFSLEKDEKIFFPNDTDFFYLNSSKTTRIKVGDCDLVEVRHTNISDLLLSFDLPCVRIAQDLETEDIYISLQCLYSVWFRKYPMPLYCQSYDTLMRNVGNHPKLSYRFRLLSDRMEKYKQRGFQPEFMSFNATTWWSQQLNHPYGSK